MNAFKSVDMSKNFYFSYTYDITSTLQRNLTGAPKRGFGCDLYNDRFAWNHHMLSDFVKLGDGETRKNYAHWVMPLMHGHVDQASQSALAQTFFKNDLIFAFRADCPRTGNLYNAYSTSITAFRWSTISNERRKRRGNFIVFDRSEAN
jgi:hypothetical protein